LTVLREFVNSQNIYDSLKNYFNTKSYDHLLDVLRELVMP